MNSDSVNSDLKVVNSSSLSVLDTDETKNLNLVKTQSESKMLNNTVTQITIPSKGTGLLTVTDSR